MDLSIYLSVAVLNMLPAGMTPAHAAELRYLQALALVESGGNFKITGDRGYARGGFQMHRAAWIDAQDFQRKRGARVWLWSDWQNPTAQREMALAYLKVCAKRLEGEGVTVDPVNLYLCYGMGFQGFKNSSFDRSKVPPAKLNAAERVEALFLHAR
jgi:hypothetical protein